MKKTTTSYGLYSIAAMTVIFLASYLIFRKKPNWELQEVIGYGTIVVSLSFVYFGIKRWRDQANGGALTFGKGIRIGTLILLFPSVAFGLFSWIQVSYLDPDFNERYYGDYVIRMKQTLSGEELRIALQKLAEEKEMFTNPVAQFGIMFLTVFIIGFIITIISALILRRDRGQDNSHLNL